MIARPPYPVLVEVKEPEPLEITGPLCCLFLHDPTWSATPSPLYCVSWHIAFLKVGVAMAIPKRLIDVQKMNWKFSTGVHEQTGVCLHRHCGQNGTGGYTLKPQNTGQCCDCQ